MQSLSANVRNLPLFAELDEISLSRLLKHSDERRFEAEETLFLEGEDPQHLHVVLEGTIELFKGSVPRDYGLMLLAPGDLFMPAAAVFEEPYLNSARTLVSSKVLFVPADAVRSEIRLSLQLAFNISRVLAGQFRMATRHLIDLKCLTAAQRLAAFLLRLADASSGPARLPVPKRYLASRVGMTPETLSRALQVLAEHGLVVRGKKVIVRDRARIDAYLGTLPYPSTAEDGLGVHAY